MPEFNMDALIWFILGAVAMLVAVGLLIAIKVHKIWLDAEKRMEFHRMRIENWKATPQRLAMSERKK